MTDRRLWTAAIALLLATTAPRAEALAEPTGDRPTYTDRKLSEVPNGKAIDRQIWSPGLDDGYVPQGLTFADGALFVATYRSTDPAQGRGACRLYRLDPDTGRIASMLDLPPACGHAGGMARGPKGRLFVADTRVVFEIALAGGGEKTLGRVVREMKLAGDVRGSFAAGSGDALWLGTYAKEGRPRLYKFSFARLAAKLDETMAEASVVLPLKAQGAAFDAKGRLWVSISGSTMGALVVLDPATGAVSRRYAMPAGLEDLSFEPTGALWTLSEAGSRRWSSWTTFFPVVFRLDPARLE